jgi:N6-L-threonylcarbamoyladenine synthase
VLYHLRGQDALRPTPPPDAIPDRADVAASFEEALVDTLVAQTFSAAQEEGLETIVVAGGVACNRRLRERMLARAEAEDARVVFPAPHYCSDNAAMIAGIGFHLLREGRTAGLDLDAQAR